MMKIQVFGKGCAKCKKTYQLIEEELEREGLLASITHITDLNELVERGIMITPTVMVDGEVKVEGRVPRASEIRSWF